MKKFVSNNLEESKKFAEGFAKEILVGKRAGNKALVLALIGDLGKREDDFCPVICGGAGRERENKKPDFYNFQKIKNWGKRMAKKRL